MLVPSLGGRDVANQAVRVVDVASIVFVRRMRPAIVPPVQSWEAKFQIAQVQERKRVSAWNGNDQHPVVREDTMQFVQQFLLLVNVFEHIQQRDGRERPVREGQRRCTSRVDNLQPARGFPCLLYGPPADIDAHQTRNLLGSQRSEETPIATAKIEMGHPVGGHMLPCVRIPAMFIRIVWFESRVHIPARRRLNGTKPMI